MTNFAVELQGEGNDVVLQHGLRSRAQQRQVSMKSVIPWPVLDRIWTVLG